MDTAVSKENAIVLIVGKIQQKLPRLSFESKTLKPFEDRNCYNAELSSTLRQNLVERHCPPETNVYKVLGIFLWPVVRRSNRDNYSLTQLQPSTL